MRIESYDLHLDVDFQHASVSGLVGIKLEGAGRQLALDSVGLEIKSARVNGARAPFRLDKTAGILRISTGSQASVVEIEYEKTVSDEVIFGLYKSKYGDRNYFLVTDLEPTEARTLFPCKDDPSYKAVFRLEVVTDKGLTVISNSSTKSRRETNDGRTLHVFNPTPRMSTYLFFLGVGDFEELKRKSGDTEVIVASRPGQAEKGRFILNVSTAVLADYSKYFGVPYPLEKLHLIALPEYHAGAMENWGAITSREAFVLVDENSGVLPRKRAALVMIHEIAHMWFGDLVTMKWWNDLWLNESFATFMQYKMLDRLRPEWDAWTDFLRTDTFHSMNQDALQSTHPIEVDVETPGDVGQVFDAISYGKGANVIRMIESYIGEDSFRRGVSHYLKDFSYANARGADLWRHLEKASGQPVSKIMGAWVRMKGYPLVEASASGGKLRLKQRRFCLSGSQRSETWPIPITLRFDGEEKKMLLDTKAASMDLPEGTSLFVNPDHTGYYSVLYDSGTYERLARGFASLGPHDKGGLMNDLFLLLQAGEVEPALYFKFVSLCNQSPDHLVTVAVTDQLSYLNSIAGDVKKVADSRLRFLTSQIRRLGVSPRKGEDQRMKDERESVATELASADGGFARSLADRFADYSHVEPDMKTAVALAHVNVKGAGAFDELLTMVKKEDSEVERGRIYHALTSFREPELIRRALDLPINGEVSRSDVGYTLQYAALNPHARDALWSWIPSRFKKLWSVYGGSQQVFLYLDSVIPRCGVGHEREVRAFINRQMKKYGGITFRRTLEQLEVNSRLRARLISGS